MNKDLKDLKNLKFDNKIKIILDANSKNEAVARVSVASFVAQLNPTLQDMEDIKMAVSEAVTNSIIHGYDGKDGEVIITCGLLKEEEVGEVGEVGEILEDSKQCNNELHKKKNNNNILYIQIEDMGIGINNIEKAMEPLYTSKPNMERSGMGFTVMEAFMDNIEVVSEKNIGTKVVLTKKIKSNNFNDID